MVKKYSLGGYLILEGLTFSVSWFFEEIPGVECGEEVVFSLVIKAKGGVHFLF